MKQRTFQDGDIVASRYRVIRFIARGGAGEAYEAEDAQLHARGALKTLRPEGAGNEFVLARFRREISLARKITHPNVCRVFDLGLHPSAQGQISFLTMELLDGESLRGRLQRAGRIRPPEALGIVEQMAAGLSAAHAHGMVHRDFKSDNVMLVPAGEEGQLRVVVTDFGLARSAEPAGLSTGSGVVRGTAAYMAPEQARGGDIGPPADVYALGVVMFEMVTGALPFGGETVMEVAFRRLNAPAPSPRGLVPDLDPPWDRAIFRWVARGLFGLPRARAREALCGRLRGAGILARRASAAGAVAAAGQRRRGRRAPAPPPPRAGGGVGGGRKPPR